MATTLGNGKHGTIRPTHNGDVGTADSQISSANNDNNESNDNNNGNNKKTNSGSRKEPQHQQHKNKHKTNHAKPNKATNKNGKANQASITGANSSSVSTTTTTTSTTPTYLLSDETPFPGMVVELKDRDNIWSSAMVLSVSVNNEGGRRNSGSGGNAQSNGNDNVRVHLRYDGWSNEWDETLAWQQPPTRSRIVRLFTYTKRVKCLVDLDLRSDTTNSTPISAVAPSRSKHGHRKRPQWPCAVQLRMPHPGSVRAEELLRLELNVYVIPYSGSPSASASARTNHSGDCVEVDALEEGREGRWMHKSRLRPFRKPDAVATDPNYARAWNRAVADPHTLGVLPPKPFAAGSLLRPPYRVTEFGGRAVHGVWFHGGFEGYCYNANNASDDNNKPSSSSSSSSSSQHQSQTNTDNHSKQHTYKKDAIPELEESEEEYLPPQLIEPPTMPLPLRVPHDQTQDGVKWLEHGTRRWGAYQRVNGNDVFFGSYMTRTEALASLPNHNEKQNQLHSSSHYKHKHKYDPREVDAATIDLETCVYAAEKAGYFDKPQSSSSCSSSTSASVSASAPPSGGNENPPPTSAPFSLHHWTVRRIMQNDFVHETVHGRSIFCRKRQRVTATSTATATSSPIGKKSPNNGDDNKFSSGEAGAALSQTSRRKSSVPRKVNLQRRCYISTTTNTTTTKKTTSQRRITANKV